MPIELKICGINSKNIIQTIIQNGGCQYLGFVFYPPSPRNLSIEESKTLTSIVPNHIKKVAVLVKPENSFVEKIKDQFDYLQVYDNIMVEGFGYAWFTGKPPHAGGIAGRVEATGRGVQYALREFFRHPEDVAVSGLSGSLEGKRVIVQGLGNVGYHASKFFSEEDGVKITAVIERDGELIGRTDKLEWLKYCGQG